MGKTCSVWDPHTKDIYILLLSHITETGHQRPGGLTMTLNTSRDPKSILIADGGSFIAQVIRGHKSGSQVLVLSFGTSLLHPVEIR